MGRTRGNIDDRLYPFERSNREPKPGGKGALFHCNYCNKDITYTTRIKCNNCPDFDLCIECFSVSAEVWPHKSDHPYRVIKNLNFPIISPDWSAEQEMLLLEGLKMFGLSDWEGVAEHVGTKSDQECVEHYNTYYLSAPNFIPETKNPDDIAAMAKGTGTKSTGQGSGPSNIEDTASSKRAKGTNFTGKGSDHSNVKDSDGFRRVKGSSSENVIGYNPKRHEFDIEYDNEAEEMLVDLEFNENDTEIEKEIKLRVIRAYNRRLDERNKRKDFIIERGLLDPNPIERDFTPEEKVLCRKYDPLMRFHSKEEHNELLKNVVEENRILTRISDLEEAQAAGINKISEANAYIENKRRQNRSSEQEAVGSSSGTSGRNRPDSPPGPSRTLSAVDLLSESEKQLCSETGFSAEAYMKLQEIMVKLIFEGRITKKGDTYATFERFKPSKLDRVYDMLVRKGIAPPP